MAVPLFRHAGWTLASGVIVTGAATAMTGVTGGVRASGGGATSGVCGPGSGSPPA